ncbi:hypothetical protein BV898_19270 [Hypsibius exemplaris]|uniref:Receptor ligand binding region domain-containing protein n=1 Tax=Hypsibius exemplaris TaxID=2072580 RepID=A0A9X6NLC3_HYPEX|nr:hypothetical protein BV898_19270 [Hypsibius exemplaris]
MLILVQENIGNNVDSSSLDEQIVGVDFSFRTNRILWTYRLRRISAPRMLQCGLVVEVSCHWRMNRTLKEYGTKLLWKLLIAPADIIRVRAVKQGSVGFAKLFGSKCIKVSYPSSETTLGNICTLTRHIEIITILPYNFTVDLIDVAPAMDIALDKAQAVHQNKLNITMKHLFNPSWRSCDEVASQSVSMLSEYVYNSKRSADCYAVVTTGCADSSGIASLARGHDRLLLSKFVYSEVYTRTSYATYCETCFAVVICFFIYSSFASNSFLDPGIGSPTAIALMGTYVGYARVVLEIMSYYSWYHATILLEGKAVSPYYKGLAAQLVASSRASLEPFLLEILTIVDNSNVTIKAALEHAKSRSRVLVLLSIGKTALNILKQAHDLGLANGEYVFFNVQPSQMEEYGTIGQFAHPFDDSLARTFQSLFFVTYRPGGDELRKLNSAITKRSAEAYNLRYDEGHLPLDLPPIKSSYEAVELFVMAATARPNQTVCGGLDLIRTMVNKTTRLSTGDVFISADRSRNLDLNIFGFNVTTSTMQIIGTYTWAKDNLQWSDTRKITWLSKTGVPPRDVPVCGFSETTGSCAELVVSVRAVAIAGAFTLLLFLMGSALYLSVDLLHMAPAMDVAIEKVQASHHDIGITMEHLFNTSFRSCDEVASQSVSMLSEYVYNSKRSTDCYAILTTGCADSSGIASLARGRDWLLFSNSMASNSFLNPDIGSPTAVALMGTYVGYARVLLEIMSYYAWYHATIFVEGKALTPFYKFLASQLMTSSRASVKPFTLELLTMIDNSHLTVKAVLERAKLRSRVIILLTLGTTAVQILRRANDASMADGDYPSQVDEYGTIDHFAYPLNDSVSRIYQSLFFLTYRPGGDELKALNSAIIRRSANAYNVTYADGHLPLDLPPIKSSYEAVELFVKAATELKHLSDECGGVNLVGKLANRTARLSTGDVLISGDRSRNLDLNIFGFNTTTGTMQIIGTYMWASGNLHWSTDRQITWPGINGTAPRDVPVCGFTGIDGICAASVISTKNVAVAAALASMLFLTGSTICLRWNWDRIINPNDNHTWQLNPVLLHHHPTLQSVHEREHTQYNLSKYHGLLY